MKRLTDRELERYRLYVLLCRLKINVITMGISGGILMCLMERVILIFRHIFFLNKVYQISLAFLLAQHAKEISTK